MKHVLCLTVALMFIAPACAQEQTMRIRCDMNIERSLPPAASAQLAFTLTNTSKVPVQILNWHTPFEGINAPMFTITRDGTELEYRGRMVKRSAPKKEDYFLLKPGEQRQATIDLAEAWDVAVPGRYTVKYTDELFDVIAGTAVAPNNLENLNPVELSCDPVSFVRLR